VPPLAPLLVGMCTGAPLHRLPAYHLIWDAVGGFTVVFGARVVVVAAAVVVTGVTSVTLH